MTEEQSANRQQIVRLKADLASAQLWAPYGGDNYQYVFVVTYGRSGSTLVQGLLNSVDGYQIRGENRGAALHLYRYWSALEEAHRSKVGLARAHQPWYGIDEFDPEAARMRIRQMFVTSLLRPDRGVRVTGFKEITWWSDDYEDYAVWMRDTFPGARFILNTRDHESVLASKWWAKRDPDVARRQLLDYEDKMDRLEKALVGSTYRLHYDEFIADPNVLKGMFEWLGEHWNRSKIDRVLSTKHSY